MCVVVHVCIVGQVKQLTNFYFAPETLHLTTSLADLNIFFVNMVCSNQGDISSPSEQMR